MLLKSSNHSPLTTHRPMLLTSDDVLYEDNHCLAVAKPGRMLTVGDETGDANLLDLAKAYLKAKYHKPGEVFLGVVHRLDRPVSGIVLFARTSKAAARLAEQFRTRAVEKTYRAVVTGRMPTDAGELVDWLVKDPRTNVSRTVAADVPGAKRSLLGLRCLRATGSESLLELTPQTGRSHQIRVQLASRGWPICGDGKYGSAERIGGRIALHAAALAFRHPVRDESIELTLPPPAWWDDHWPALRCRD